MQTAGSFKNTSAVVENIRVSPVHDVSKFNPNHDELGRFTTGGAGRRVSRMPKSKSKNKSNAQAEKIVSQLTAKLGKDVADKLKPMILPAIKIWNTSGDSSQEIKVNGKSVSWSSSKKNVTAGDIFNIIADELGNEALGMSMDNVTNAFRLKSQMPKSGKIIEKFNPNHDELGRFTFGSGMGAPAGNIKPVEKLASQLKINKDWSKVRAVDSGVRKQIVKAFNDAPQQLDKEQLKSWDETEKIINQQYDLLTKKLGVKIEFVDYDPYKNSQDMFDSFRDTGVLKIMKTSVTGSHTYWSDATNDKFRAVHDAFGHLATGVGFDRHGEQAAYEAHKSMFPPSCYLALASELKGQNAYMVETGNFPDQRLVALPEKLQKLFMAKISKQMSEDEMSDKDNLFEIGGTHHASNGRNFAKKTRNLMSILGKVADMRTVSKETPTVSSVHLETAMGNQKKKKKKRTKRIFVEEIEKKNAKLKNPKGGLTQAGRDKFNRETGSKLKAGVKGAADTPEKMRRKGSFLTRFFTNPSGPMVNDKGEPTRLALSANAWGEPVPKNRSDAARLAEKGRNLLDRYENTKKVEKFNPYHDELGRFTSGAVLCTRRISAMPKNKSRENVKEKAKSKKKNMNF
jgi:hypothetical protein